MLRIIAGTHRGRKIQFEDSEGLRPTGDRIRETLFNWLSTSIVGADCLDCFAGSGALGFEALSRGAASVTMLESSRKVYNVLNKNIETLSFENSSVHCVDAMRYLKSLDQQFDVVFLDPPFQSDFVKQCLPLLKDRLKPNGLLYVETNKKSVFELPDGFECLKEKTAGQVTYRLLRAE